ncbi:MAG TPA: polyphenol oxidase family protein [Candidatus Krumholzibacteria bacterium]|nr:polyphenol oxidase family protein [Candidatus Krumholzibacteria bacterium]HPD70636.1 polyphenol oxidase family protein [Candidatus Krumholzibacteria bacterium]HRY39664.1 polyphenol oxidase family protein [Candidatus Krumholzibacteria bacterium]
MSRFHIDDSARWPLGRFGALAGVPGVAHAVTTRAGPHFGPDARAAPTARAAAAVAAELGLAGAAWVKQVHGGTVLRAREPGIAGEADALVCDTPGLAVLGRSADCPLVLLAGLRADGTPAVGVAHASWRSTVRRITVAAVERMRDELGVDPATISAGIGPSAGPCCYEVGPEVRDEALARLGGGGSRFFAPAGDRWHLDLWAANLAQLAAAGVPESRVCACRICTICRGERFWSWRVQREAAGRFAAVIGLVAP